MRQSTEYIVGDAIGLILCAVGYVCYGLYEGTDYCLRDSGEPLWFRIWAAVGIVVFTLGFIACWFLW